MRVFCVLMVLAFLGVCSRLAHGDVVHLKDGTQKEGEIVEETDSVVKLKVFFASGGSAVLPIPRETIEKIEKKEYVKPEPPKKEEPVEEKDETKVKEKAKDKDKIPPAPAAKPISGYRRGSFGGSLSKVPKPARESSMRVPGYISRLDLPKDIADRLPEDYVPPMDAGFSNVRFYTSHHASMGHPEFKTCYVAYQDRIYLIWGKEGLDAFGYVKPFSQWVQERREELGGETELREDGTMIWDQDKVYAKFTPTFLTDEAPTPSSLLDCYDFVLYDKGIREQVLSWAKQHLPSPQ